MNLFQNILNRKSCIIKPTKIYFNNDDEEEEEQLFR